MAAVTGQARAWQRYTDAEATARMARRRARREGTPAAHAAAEAAETLAAGLLAEHCDGWISWPGQP